MEEQPLIEGDRLILRPLSLDDISDTYIGWLNDPEVTQYNSHGATVYTHEEAIEYVTRVRSNKSYFVLALFAKDSGKHIGNISLQNIHAINQCAEFAILVGDKDYWGKGIAKEASHLILKHGFEVMSLHRIYCGTSAANEPMQRLATALGFKQEGIRREAMHKNGAFVDIIEYGLLRADFAQ